MFSADFPILERISSINVERIFDREQNGSQIYPWDRRIFELVFFLSRQMIESRLNPAVLNLLLFYFRTRNEINRRESPTVTIEI